ncbi:MAG: hypothetical protein HOP18_06660 [Deltaproteobacteria bacterium]|nr:hypothetical protein [Deltaproteobacteria bacterium]
MTTTFLIGEKKSCGKIAKTGMNVLPLSAAQGHEVQAQHDWHRIGV